MKHSALALGLVPLLVLPAPANSGGDGTPHAAPHPVRRYETASLSRPPAPSVEEGLLPGLHPFQSEPGNVLNALWDYEGEPSETAPNVEALLIALLGEQLIAQHCEYRFDADGGLVLTAPEATQRQVAQVLATLDRHLNAAVRLRVEAFELGAGGAARPTPAELERELAAARARGALRSLVLELASGRPETIDLTRTLWTVLGYEVEVAQAMVASHPRMSLISVGLRLSLAAAPAPGGGVHLACIVQDGSLREEPQTRRVGRNGNVTIDTTVLPIPLPGVYSHLALERRAHAFNAYLGPQGTLVLTSGLGTDAGARRQVVVLSLEGGELPVRSVLTGLPDGDVSLLDRHALAPPRTRLGGRLGSDRPRPRALPGPLFSPTLASASIDPSGQEGLAEQSLLQDSYQLQTAEGPLLVLRHFETPAVEMHLPARDQRNVELELTLRRSGTGEVLATLGLPVALGSSASALVGTETTHLLGHGTDVAQAAAGAAPYIDTLFDGLLVVARVQPSAAGGAPYVELDVYAQVIDGEHALALGTPFLERIDTPRLVTLFGGRRLRADGATHTVGDGGSRPGGLVLEARAR